MPPRSAPIERYRPQYALDESLLAWADSLTGPGGAFVSEGHAIEFALARLRAEETYIRDRCRREKIPFKAALFWQLYASEIEASRPPRMGRPRKDEKPTPAVTRRPTGAFVEVELGKWVDAAVESSVVQTTSHLVEASLRHLHGLGNHKFPGAAFPFDGDGLWKRYRKLLD